MRFFFKPIQCVEFGLNTASFEFPDREEQGQPRCGNQNEGQSNAEEIRAGPKQRIPRQPAVRAAEDGGQLIGAVRLCTENGHAILRTMRVSESYRRQGIGKQMLEVFESLLANRECRCRRKRHAIR